MGTRCSTVQCGGKCCSAAERGLDQEGGERNAVLRAALPPDVRLVAWLRRRSGVECDFGEVFEEIFGTRDAVGEAKFEAVFHERGAASAFDCLEAFRRIDTLGKGAISAADFEMWQDDVEKKEIEGLRNFRDWLRARFATPSAAYSAMGKGEGDVLSEIEFQQCLKKIGFTVDRPLELFRYVDKDFSGEVTFAEFKNAMRSVGQPRRLASTMEAGGRRSQSRPDSSPPRSSMSSKAASPRRNYSRETKERTESRESAAAPNAAAPPKRRSVTDADELPPKAPTTKRANSMNSNSPVVSPRSGSDSDRVVEAQASRRVSATDSTGQSYRRPSKNPVQDMLRVPKKSPRLSSKQSNEGKRITSKASGGSKVSAAADQGQDVSKHTSSSRRTSTKDNKKGDDESENSDRN